MGANGTSSAHQALARLSESRGPGSACLLQSRRLSLRLSGHVGLTGQKKGAKGADPQKKTKKDSEDRDGRGGNSGERALRKCGVSDGVGTNAEEGGGDGRLGGSRALRLGGNGRDGAGATLGRRRKRAEALGGAEKDAGRAAGSGRGEWTVPRAAGVGGGATRGGAWRGGA